NYLTALGDTRLGVGLRNSFPDIDWVNIPAGKMTHDWGASFTIKAFRLARYLLTNIQFETFIKADDGYRDERWWKNIERSQEPEAPNGNQDNYPRTNVSWYEAIAFCRWLSARVEKTVRLPTELEWDYAAAGGNAWRKYPWGNDWDPARC